MENSFHKIDSKKKNSSFSCIICLEKRFLSITTPCGHMICGPCGEKVAETGVSFKCPFCRKMWPKISTDMKITFHDIADVKSEEIQQVLCHALQNQKKDIFSKLIENNFSCGTKCFELGKQRKDVDDFENEQRREVHMAAEHGNLQRLVEFAESNVDVNQKYIVWSSTPLLAAVEEEHIECVKFLVEKNADVNVTDSRGRDCMWFSVMAGNCEITKYLCENNSNVNVSYAGGESPLHQATRRGFLNICKVLIQHGANLNELDYMGRNVSYLAADHGHAEVLNLLLKSGANMPPESPTLQAVLHDLPYYGQLNIIKILAQHGMKLNVAFDCGETPLSRAIAGNHFETVKYLIDAGVSFETPKNHKPMVHYAAMASLEIVKLLVEKGVNFENVFYNGVCPREIMHWYGKYHIIQFLDNLQKKKKPKEKKRKRGKKKKEASRKKRKVVIKRKKRKVVKRTKK